MAEALVSAFNWRLGPGVGRDRSIDGSEQRTTYFKCEEAPIWTAIIKSLPETLDLNKQDQGNPDRFLLKRNIKAPMGYLYTLRIST